MLWPSTLHVTTEMNLQMLSFFQDSLTYFSLILMLNYPKKQIFNKHNPDNYYINLWIKQIAISESVEINLG